MALVFMVCFANVTHAQEEDDACFAVTAYNTFGESGYSEEVCSGPFAFVITSKVTLAWNASPNADGYKVYFKKQGETNWSSIGGKDVGNVLTVDITACELFCAQPPDGVTVAPQ
jgi:hypothetical protein